MVLRFNPQHLSLYILTVGRGYSLYHLLPEDDVIATEYIEVSDFLKESGFNHYEVSNFSREGYESRHNLAYWESKSVAALGPSSTGLLADEEGALRYKWKASSAMAVTTFKVFNPRQHPSRLHRRY